MHKAIATVALFAFMASSVHGFDMQTCQSHAVFVTVPVPRSDVMSLMKKELGKDFAKVDLEDKTDVFGEGLHPVQFEFDDFSECVVPGAGFLGEHQFREFAFQIPYVHHKDLNHNKPMAFQPAAFVNNTFGSFAVWTIGAKRSEAPIVMDSNGDTNSYKVDGIIDLTYTPTSDYKPISAFKDDWEWAAVKEGKGQPELGYDWCITSLGNKYTCSAMHYHFDDTQVRNLSGVMNLHSLKLKDNPAFNDLTVDLTDAYAYEVKTSWTLEMGCP